MLLVGLTGGIGSGKSTVAAMLRDRGAVVIDTDQAARQVVQPGGSAYQAIVDHFGHAVLSPTGALDRSALANLVFEDPSQLAALNTIVHPAVRSVVAARLVEEASSDHVVVLEVPLLVESGSRKAYGLLAVLVVDCPEEVAIERLVRGRGMLESDARRRIAAQATRAERRAAADLVIDNGGTLEQLEAEVSRAWQWMSALRDGSGT